MSIQSDYIDIKNKIFNKEFNRLNDMQRKAVFNNSDPLLILAGAGSGKTTVIVNRIAFLIKYGNAYYKNDVPTGINEDDIAFLCDYYENGGDSERAQGLLANNPPMPWNVLAITFTNKAAGELKARLEAMLGADANEIWAGTFHSMCVRILRREIENLGYAGSFTIYDTDDSIRVIKECLKDLNISDKQFPPKQMLGAISRLKDRLVTPEQAKQSAGGEYRNVKIADIYELYAKKLKSANALDFDDIICLTVELFETCPEVLTHWQNRFKYVMVDEYQDTNHAQYKLVSLLTQNHKRLCVVGDDDQSIYRFRGATIENILSFEEQFDNAVVIRLEQNYRSTQTILDAANEVIRHNSQRKGKQLWTQNPKGDKLEIYRCGNEDEEAEYVADTIEENVKNGAKYSDHAILYRMNAQSNPLERRFTRAAIPYRIIGGLRFYERKEIKDIVAYMSVINNPADTVRLKRIINEPKRGIGDATVEKAQRIAEEVGDTLFKVISEADTYASLSGKAKALREFTDMITELADLADSDEGLSLMFDEILDKTGYMAMLEAMGDEGITRIENVNELKSNIIKYTQDNEEATLSGFLEDVALVSDIDNYDADADATVMMTMHSAKGLEFPYVFIVGMEDGIFPSVKTMFDPAEMEEERRIAYVAITRAKKRLFITNASSRMMFGQTMRNRPSRFLEEIPPQYKEELGLSRMKPTSVSSSPVHSSAPSKPQYSATSKVTMSSPKPTAVGAGSKQSFRAGDAVMHKIFGKGMVLSATPMGNDTLLEIAFETKGTKKIMANFTKLDKVN